MKLKKEVKEEIKEEVVEENKEDDVINVTDIFEEKKEDEE